MVGIPLVLRRNALRVVRQYICELQQAVSLWRPEVVLIEQSRGLVTHYPECLSEWQECFPVGYRAVCGLLEAYELGSSHMRERWLCCLHRV